MKKIALLIASAMLSLSAHAASSRQTWVVNQVYNYNHQFAATDSADLATKMSTMAASPFLFYRGTAHIFYQDMATRPASLYTSVQTGYTWLGGDTHLGNFGSVRDSGGTQVFAVGDFDEGYL